jgi:ABC-type glycerol-3-phosphate transport system substrate-binding protein
MLPFRRPFAWLLFSMCFLTGCAPEAETAQPATTVPTETIAATQPPSTPTLDPTAAAPITLTVWFPDDLLPINDDTLNALVEAEITEFASLENGVRVEIRRKATRDVGGIMSTLQAASSVAPGALPDMTLIRREDLMLAVEEGLIQPLEGRIASSVIADLFPSALRLGRVDDQLYGLPYLLDIYLYAYHDNGEPAPSRWTFDAVVERGQTFTVPTVRANGMADTLWLQYTAAGGKLPEDGVLELTPGAVADVLSFYEQLSSAHLIAPGTNDYASPSNYIEPLRSGRIESGIVNTALLRQLIDADPPLRFASVPTSNGQPVTLTNGWMWVVVTPNSERQVLAGRFLNWMMEAGRHSTFAQAIAMPPTQRSALRRWRIEGIDNTLLTEMLVDALPAQPEVGTSSAARAFQAAWLDVLSGRMSASEATAAALER